MSKLVKIDYYCPKCEETLSGNLNLDMPDEMFTEEEKERVQNYFLNLHNKREHTRCLKCRRKIQIGVESKESWGVRIVGKTFDRPKRAGDTGVKIWTGIFCNECLKLLDEERDPVST